MAGRKSLLTRIARRNPFRRLVSTASQRQHETAFSGGGFQADFLHVTSFILAIARGPIKFA